jgi:hypothetical protein
MNKNNTWIGPTPPQYYWVDDDDGFRLNVQTDKGLVSVAITQYNERTPFFFEFGGNTWMFLTTYWAGIVKDKFCHGPVLLLNS